MTSSPPRFDLPPVLVVLPGGRSADEREPVSSREARERFSAAGALVTHAAMTARRLGMPPPPRSARLLDALELFAFVRPARFCAPSPTGLALALGLEEPVSGPEMARVVRAACERLLAEIAGAPPKDRDLALAQAEALGRAGWSWAPAVIGAIREAGPGRPWRGDGLDVWARISKWEDEAPAGEAGSKPIDPKAARERLAALLKRVGLDEARPAQADFAAETAFAFQPREREGEPRLMLAEAGTGIGKTLGYLAPASLWAEAQRAGGVGLAPTPAPCSARSSARAAPSTPIRRCARVKAVVRKGRENYLCLLNLQDA